MRLDGRGGGEPCTTLPQRLTAGETADAEELPDTINLGRTH